MHSSYKDYNIQSIKADRMFRKMEELNSADSVITFGSDLAKIITNDARVHLGTVSLCQHQTCLKIKNRIIDH